MQAVHIEHAVHIVPSHTPHAGICLVVCRVGTSAYRPRAILCQVVRGLSNPVLKSVWSFGEWGISLTRPMLESVSSFLMLESVSSFLR